MWFRVDPSRRTVKVRVRRYPKAQRIFLKKYVKQLVKMGSLVPNPDAEWKAAPHIVPKPNSKVRFRMIIDLRPVNSVTTKTAWPMPHLDSEMQDFAGSKCVACLDFLLWILATAPTPRLVQRLRNHLPR